MSEKLNTEKKTTEYLNLVKEIHQITYWNIILSTLQTDLETLRLQGT